MTFVLFNKFLCFIRGPNFCHLGFHSQHVALKIRTMFELGDLISKSKTTSCRFASRSRRVRSPRAAIHSPLGTLKSMSICENHLESYSREFYSQVDTHYKREGRQLSRALLPRAFDATRSMRFNDAITNPLRRS